MDDGDDFDDCLDRARDLLGVSEDPTALAEAACAVDRALAQRPDDVPAWLVKSQILSAQGDDIAALACAEMAARRAPRMAEAQGIRTGAVTCLGMALSNALVALAGALFAQANGFADVTLGTGTIVVGLAAVIIGETVLPRGTVPAAVLGCILGSLLYRVVVALALEADVLGLQASDLNLITALLVGAALILPATRARLAANLAWDFPNGSRPLDSAALDAIVDRLFDGATGRAAPRGKGGTR